MIVRMSVLIMVVFWMLVGGLVARCAHSAELPYVIMHGYSRPQSMVLNKFGVYTPKYYERRWKKLCQGGGRYVAMAEAFDMNKPQPCTQ